MSENVKRLGLRKTLALATIAVMIALLACSGPASTPDTVGTRPPAKSEAMPEETTSGASGQTPTETPNHIDATTAPPPSTPSPKVTVGPTGTPTAPTTAPTSVRTRGCERPRHPDPRHGTPASTKESAPPAMTLTMTVAPIPSDIPEYSRSQWKHWADEDGDCQDARQEVLIAESLVEVTFEPDKTCRVETGRWYGAFTGTYVELPGDLDVDHLVPLKNAHLSGGWRWQPSRKVEYANYLDDGDHLIAVTAGANRSNGAKGPEEWRPPDEGYWCEYAVNWTEVKSQWGLTMTRDESRAVLEMLGRVRGPGEGRGAERVRPHPSLHGNPSSSVYGSCEEAEAAGAMRVLGSQGGGRGFPKVMVPSARDGDGDGVVCER